jgi:transposase
MSKKTHHKRPKYTLEFKQDAARLVLEKGYTHQQAADNLGISLSAIGRWVRAERGPSTKHTADHSSHVNLSSQTELVRLRKENEQLRMEREILKKAAVFFANEID